MPAYLLKLSSNAQFSLPDGANAAVVFANSEADARSIAEAQYTGDSNTAWEEAAITEIVEGADLEGFRLRVAVLDSSPVVDVMVTGGSGDTIDDIGDAMVVALNETSVIAGAAYAGSTQILTIADGATDGLGDKKVVVQMLPPSTLEGADKAPIAGFVGEITDEGASTDDLSVVLGSDDVAVPLLYAMVKQV